MHFPKQRGIPRGSWLAAGGVLAALVVVVTCLVMTHPRATPGAAKEDRLTPAAAPRQPPARPGESEPTLVWLDAAELAEPQRSIWEAGRQAADDAQELFAAGKYLEAVEHAQTALATFDRLDSTRRRDQALTRLLLGRLSKEHSDHYGHAAERLEQARKIFEELELTTDPLYGECLFELATLTHDRGLFSEADELYQRCLVVQRAAFGDESAAVARTLNHQGRLHIAWWKDYAHGKCYTALGTRERVLGKEHPDYAESLEDLAVHHLNMPSMEAYEQAERLLEEALRIRERHQGTQHPALAETLSLMGLVMAERGDLAQALLTHRRAMQLAGEARGATHPAVARMQQRFATLSLYDWDMSRGKRLYRRALEIWEQQGLSRSLEYAMAEADYARIWLLEADLLLDEDLGDMKAVDDLYWRARSSAEAIPGATSLPFFVRCLAGHAALCYRANYTLHDRQFARQQLQQALAIISQSRLGELHPMFEPFLTALTDWHRAQGEYREAEAAAQQRVKLVRKLVGVSHPDRYTDALQGLGGVYLHAGNRASDVTRIAQECLTLQEDLFRQNAAREGETGRIALLFKRCYSVSGQLSAAAAATIGDATSLYREVFLLRGAASACRQAEQLVHDHSELEPQVRALSRTRRRLTRLLYQPAPNEEQAHAGWLTQVLEAGDDKERLECELAVAVRPFLREAAPLAVAELQRRLPPHAAWIDFFEYVHHAPPPDHRGRLIRNKHLVAFVLRADRPVTCVPLGSSRVVREAVERWRLALTDDPEVASSSTLEDAAGALANLVWQPLVDHIGDAQELIIAPDGPLDGVSFACLPTGEGGEYLLERYAISYMPSARHADEWLRRSEPSAAVAPQLLAVGGVNYEGLPVPHLVAPQAEWHDLPASAVEVREVSDRFQQSNDRTATVLGQDTAQVDQLLETLTSSRWTHVHFAGHGFLATPSPDHDQMLERDFFARNRLLLSGLVLAPPHSADGVSVLTAEELSGLDLRQTRLVVLSACETGLGHEAAGEGALGLQRVLLNAGVESVVSSLWRVDDAATCVLMREFYRLLWEQQEPPLMALRKAQLHVLQNPQLITDETRYLVSRGVKPGSAKALPPPPRAAGRASPAAWGAFVLTGRTGTW